MLPWLKDDYCSSVEASGLTSNMQFQQANSFILKVFQRDALLPNPTRTQQGNELKKILMRSGCVIDVITVGMLYNKPGLLYFCLPFFL